MRKLLDAVESGLITPDALGWRRRVALMRDWDGEVREQARRLLRVSDAARTSVLRAYYPTLEMEGHAERGRGVFLAACSGCHVFGEEGSSFGPDLGTVSHWSPHAMLEAILAPSRAVADGYEMWRIERSGGVVHSGVMRSETATAVTLAMEGGVEITIPRTEIDAMAQLEGSSMPEGLEESISMEEMADLIAFLTRAP